MDRATTHRRRTSRFLGPTALSILVHGVLLTLFLVFSARLRPAPLASRGLFTLRALPALDEAEEEGCDFLDIQPLPEVEAEALEDVLIEEVFPAWAEEDDEPLPVDATMAETPTLDRLDDVVPRVSDGALPTLLAAVPHEKPAPRAPPPGRLPPTPAPRPTVVATTTTLARPAPSRAVRRAPPRRRGRALRAIQNPLHYPPGARQRGLQGRARVELSIDASGRVTGVVLVTSSGYADLDQAAIASAWQWRFQPPGERRRVRTWLVFRLT